MIYELISRRGIIYVRVWAAAGDGWTKCPGTRDRCMNYDSGLQTLVPADKVSILFDFYGDGKCINGPVDIGNSLDECSWRFLESPP